ncbi:hypothetical protein PMAYCL1PPCAC_30794, partial [Pristionchus mayeri]
TAMNPLLLLSLLGIGTSTADELLSVNLVIRHGDRAATTGWATPLSPIILFRGHDELTNAGVDNAYAQGMDFRKKYVDTGFVNKRFLPSEVYIRSSTVNRCLMSASSFTNGLFQDTSKLRAVIPPIYTQENATDGLVYPHLECPDGWEDVIERFNLNATENFATAGLVALLASEWPCPDIPAELFDAIVSELPNKLIKMPENYKTCAQGPAKVFMYSYIEMLAGAGANFNAVRIRRVGGLLTNQLLTNFAAAACTGRTCPPEPKLRVYYTHDVVELAVAHIFGVLGKFKGVTPAFSSALVFETWGGANGPYVKIYLKDGQDAGFVDTNNCATDCSLSTVTTAASAFAITSQLQCAAVVESTTVAG